MSHSLRVVHYQLGWKQIPEEDERWRERVVKGGGRGVENGRRGNKAEERVLMNKS